jgi:hypothetical protein
MKILKLIYTEKNPKIKVLQKVQLEISPCDTIFPEVPLSAFKQIDRISDDGSQKRETIFLVECPSHIVFKNKTNIPTTLPLSLIALPSH